MRGGVTLTLVLAGVGAGGCIAGDDEGSPPPRPAVPGVSDAPTGVHLYVANLDGSGIRRLTRGESVSLGPVWAPSGRAIAVRTSRRQRDAAPGARPEGAIEIFAPDGRHIRRIGAPEATGRVAWSPDSLRLAYIVNPPPRQAGRPGSLVVRPVGGGGARTISKRARPHVQDGPAWSPDGRRIAFPSLAPPPTNRDLAVVGADGSGERRLTRDESEDTEPHWVDDDRVLFQQLILPPRPGDSRQLVVVDADGGRPRVAVAGLDYSYPAASPDGRHVAVTGTLDVPSSPRLNLHVARLGGRAKRIAPDLVLARPTWSPDGKQIAYATGSRVVAVRRDGSGRRVLVELAGREIREVAWSPDGRRIAFTTGTPMTPPGHE